MNEEFSIVDLLDDTNLPLKNRVNKMGYYVPLTAKPFPTSQKERPLIPLEPLEEGEQYRFHFDMSRCVGCQCCVVACNEQNNNPASVNWRRVGEIEGGVYPDTKKYHLSMACNHCLDPSCLTGCPTDAYVKLEDGIVQQQAEECIGCGYCTWNCPYGVPQFNPERNIVTKCDMCHSRLKEGQLPACVAACPEEAIQIEKVNISEWRENHTQADAPEIPDSDMTISTTRITLPKNAPENMLSANRHRIEPEKPHTSLIFMTVLTQLATGGFLALWLGDLFSHFVSFLRPLQDFLAFGACGMLAVTGIALFAAIFHLGRPLYAYKALKMWKRSWLSREVLLFALFSMAGGLYAVLQLIHHLLMSSPHVLSGDPFFGFPIKAFGNDTIFKLSMALLGALVVILGLAGVYASAKIYLVPARPAWNTVRTPIRFFLTGFILGPLFALVVYSFYVRVQSPGIIPPFFKGPVLAFLAISIVSGFLQLIVLFWRLFSLSRNESNELSDSTFLLIHRFKKHFLTRLSLLFLGSFILPFVLFYFLSLGNLSHVGFIVFSLASFGLSLAGEFLGRYLFFVTVVPKNIPGSFFTANGGVH